MISRRTIYSLLLTLLLAIGIRVWALSVRDDCDRAGPSNPATPNTVAVESGTRTIDVPCTYWVPRQPTRVQILLLVNVALGVVFIVSAATDWTRYRARRRVGLA